MTEPDEDAVRLLADGEELRSSPTDQNIVCISAI